MTGIDIVDTIVVRSVEKGTKITKERVKPQNWAGKEFKEYEKAKRKFAGNRGLASSRGTNTLRLAKLVETKIPSLSGHYISTARGTGLRIG